MKVIVLSSTIHALPLLHRLHQAGHLLAVLGPRTNPDQETVLFKEQIEQENLPFYATSQQALSEDLQELIPEFDPDLAINFGFPFPIPEALFTGITYGVWNVHFSFQVSGKASATIWSSKPHVSGPPVVLDVMSIVNPDQRQLLENMSQKVADSLSDKIALQKQTLRIDRYFR